MDVNERSTPREIEPIIEYEDLTDYKPSQAQLDYEEAIRKRIRERRRQAERRRVRRNRTVAIILLVIIILIICKACSSSKKHKAEKTSGKAQSSSAAETEAPEEEPSQADTEQPESQAEAEPQVQHKIETIDGLTFVDDILIVNKTYSLPSDYAPGVSDEALNAFNEMAAAAMDNDGIYLYINSSYRSYWDQAELYNGYAWDRGEEEADRVSSRPGHSEHQTGLAFDVNTTEFSFDGTPEANWLEEHCAEYGFIIRFPEGKEDKTGYEYEPWHIRYLGKENAQKVKESGLCLEEYLGVTSDYKYAEDMQEDSSQQSEDTANTWTDDGTWTQEESSLTGNWADDYGYNDTTW